LRGNGEIVGSAPEARRKDGSDDVREMLLAESIFGKCRDTN